MWGVFTNNEGNEEEHGGWAIAYDGKKSNQTVLRLRVPGGWLYRIESSKEMTFVPHA